MFRYLSAGGRVLACIVVLALGQGARAQHAPIVDEWRASMSGWTFAPAATPTGGAVLGFLAWAEPGTTSGNNMTVLWYERNGTAWDVYGWKTNDFPAAVAYARAAVSNPGLWGTVSDINKIITDSPPSTLPAPTAVKKGLFSDDPNAGAFMTASDPAASIQAAATAGYAAAPVLSAIAAVAAAPATPCVNTDDATTASVLDQLTFESEKALYGSSSVAAVELCCWCPCTTTCSFGPWTAIPRRSPWAARSTAGTPRPGPARPSAAGCTSGAAWPASPAPRRPRRGTGM